MAQILINATTQAETTDRISISKDVSPVSFAAMGLTAPEEIVIEFTADNGNTWETLVVTGAESVLSATNKVITIYGPLSIRFVKSLTTNPVLVSQIEDGDY